MYFPVLIVIKVYIGCSEDVEFTAKALNAVGCDDAGFSVIGAAIDFPNTPFGGTA